MTAPRDPLSDFTLEHFAHEGVTKPLYCSGTGPAVIVFTEIPGITPDVANFARRVRALGYTVVMPQLFGTPGQAPSTGYVLSSITRACLKEEFAAFKVDTTAPIATWNRALARAFHARCGGPGVGVIGMCFTGGFALAMMVDDTVVAPVLSQPSLPLPVGRARGASLPLSPEDLATVKARVDAGCPIMGLRFTRDGAVGTRFDALTAAFGPGFLAVEIDSGPGNAWGISSSAHSVLTEHLVEDPAHPTFQARERVLSFFRARLGLEARA